jgi:ubiquinone/menaquinone biosynthesis C-methylase UbiE
MTQLKEYVKNEKEVKIVSKVRADYVKKYANFLIESGNIIDGAIVVDVPCGTGDMAKAISEKIAVDKFALIDLNKNMIDSAKKKIKNNATFIVGDAGDIGTLIDFRADTIICLNGFHQYISRQHGFLDGCGKHLKRKGRLIFDVSTRGLHDEYTKNLFHNWQWNVIALSKEYGIKAQLPVWPDKDILEKYRNMLSNNGLRVIAEKEFISYKTTVEVLSDAIIIPGRSRPWIPGLGYGKRKEILEKSMENSIEKLGKHKIEHNRIFFIAERIPDMYKTS